MDILKELKLFLSRKEIDKIFLTLNEYKNIDVNDIKLVKKTDVLLCAILMTKGVFIQSLFDKGFDINRNEFLYLHHAIKTKDSNIINLLLDGISKNSNVSLYINKRDINNNNALHVAINNQLSSKLLKRLTKLGASWNQENNNSITPLFLFFNDGDYVNKELDKELVDLFIENKVDFKSNDMVKDLILTLNKNDPSEALQYLINKMG